MAESRAGEPADLGAELAAILDGLSDRQTMHVVRAFSYFSHLLNIAELNATVRHLLRITGQPALLADSPELAQSIRNRVPYLDPINRLQIELLRRYRAGDTDDLTRRGIHLSINGLTAGLRNSG